MLELRNVSKYFNKNTPSQTIALNNVTLKLNHANLLPLLVVMVQVNRQS